MLSFSESWLQEHFRSALPHQITDRPEFIDAPIGASIDALVQICLSHLNSGQIGLDKTQWDEFLVEHEACADSLMSAVQASSIFTITPSGHLCFQRFALLEQQIAQRLNVLAQAQITVEASISQLPAPSWLDADQAQAFRAILTANLTLLTGGPGSGKTTVINAAIQQLLQNQPDYRILVAAPTARVVDNLKTKNEISSPNVVYATLHHALGLTGGPNRRTRVGFEYNPDLIIIDESSMVELEVLVALLRDLPKGCRLALCGDAGQLAPVGFGAVFQKLLYQTHPTLKPYCVRLTTNHRQDSSKLATIFNVLQHGEAQECLECLRQHSQSVSDDPDSEFEWIELDTDFDRQTTAYQDNQLVSSLEAWRRHKGVGSWLVDANSQRHPLQVLCNTRYGCLGTDNTNRQIASQIAQQVSQQGSMWIEGMPIVITRNIPQYQLINGNILIVCVDSEGQPYCRNRDGDKILLSALATRSSSGTLQYGWALSIHRSQGSEYDHVRVQLQSKGRQGLTRNLLYTAFTRAKTSLTLVATASALTESLRQTSTPVGDVNAYL